MQLPFTLDQFLEVFAEYNQRFWPVAAGFWAASVVGVVLTWREPARWSSRLSTLLAVMWLWNAAGYHAWLFTRINPAAWLFAVLFAVESALLFRARAASRLEYFSPASRLRHIGAALVVYALAYPAVTIALGHRYPAAPTFGVPCPTAILTIGLLATVRGAIPARLALIPILWGFVGGSAALLLDVASDYALLGAALLMTVAIAIAGLRR